MDGLLFEILYAYDLVLMADSMEELQLKFDSWKSMIKWKGLTVNTSKTKVTVSGEECQNWVLRRRSGVKGSLKDVAGMFK